MSKHANTTGDSIHIINAFTFTDVNARNSTVVSSADVGKVARQSDNDTYYILIDTAPTWSQLTSGEFDTLAEVLANGNVTGGSDIIVETGDKITLTDAPIIGTDAANKTYVDAQIGTTNELSEILANGNTSGGTDLIMSSGDDLIANGLLTVKGTNSATKFVVEDDSINSAFLVDTTNNTVSINTNFKEASAQLEVVSTTRGFLPPKMTITQRDAIVSPTSGLTIYNTTNNDVEYFNGVSWVSMLGGDVTGDTSSVINSVPSFSSTNGKNIKDSTGVFISSGNLSVGVIVPHDRLHVLSSGTSGYSHTNRGVLITDSIGPRLTFEDAGETAGNRVITLEYENQNLSFSSLTDDGLSFDTQNILVLNRDGNVGIGITVPTELLEVAGTAKVTQLKTDILNQNTVYFTSEADLPAPVAGVITLQENTTYVMYNDDPTASQKAVILTNRLAIPDAGGVRITSVGLATVLLVYTGTDALFTTSDTFTGFLHIDEIFISAPSGTIFDIDGVLPIGSEFFPRIFLSNMGFFDTDTIGTIRTISVNMNIGAFFDCGQGLILDSVEEGLIGNWRFTNWKNEANAVMMIWKHTLRFPKIDGCTFETNANETAFDIEPSIGDEPFIIAGNSYRGSGNIYTTGTSGTITEFADSSQSGTVSSVAGTPFGESIFTYTPVGGDLVEHQFITTTGFADSNYNGTFEILEVTGTRQVRVHTLFTADGSGSYTSDVLRISDVAHGLSQGESVQITPDDFSTGYSGGYFIIAVQTDFFFVNQTFNFTGIDTGVWNTNSLTETDPRMKVDGNAGLDNSKIIAFGEMNENLNTTTVTQSVYDSINVAGTVENAVTQRFVLTNSAVGRFTYTGQEDLSGQLNAVVSATKTGSTANYRFAISINGAFPDFGSAFFAPMEVKTTKVSVTVLQPVNIVTGDTVQVMIAGQGTGDDITITDFVIEISGD